MKQTTFNTIISEMKSENGKGFIENYLQWEPCILMDSTEKQMRRIAEICVSLGYPIKTHETSLEKFVILPNGLSIIL